jgi:hypothetical protein
MLLMVTQNLIYHARLATANTKKNAPPYQPRRAAEHHINRIAKFLDRRGRIRARLKRNVIPDQWVLPNSLTAHANRHMKKLRAIPAMNRFCIICAAIAAWPQEIERLRSNALAVSL